MKLFENAVLDVHDERALTHDDVRPASQGSGGEKLIANPWRMVKRRSTAKVANDTCDVYLFVTGKLKVFPAGLLKRQVLGPAESYKSKSQMRLEAILERSESDLNSFNSACDKMTAEDEIVNPVMEGEVWQTSNVADRSFHGRIECVEMESIDLGENSPGFWDTDTKQDQDCRSTSSGMRGVSSVRMNGDSGLKDECKDSSYVLFSEPMDLDAQCENVCRQDVPGGSSAEVVRAEPQCDVTMNVEMSNALRSNPIGQSEFFTISPPKRIKSGRQNVAPTVPATCDIDETVLSSISQSSFIKELEEIHERITTTPSVKSIELVSKSAPICGKTNGEDPLEGRSNSGIVGTDESVRVTEAEHGGKSVGVEVDESESQRKCAETAEVRSSKKAAGVNMATQTQPNVIPDLPVLKSEFDSQMETVDRSLTDHERRVRSNEIWRSKNERKVDRLDAEYHHQMKILCESNSELTSDMKALKGTVKSLSDKLDRCQCDGSKDHSESSGIVSPESKRMKRDSGSAGNTKRIQTRTVSTPVRKDSVSSKKSAKRRGEGIYKSLLRVARKVISPQSRSRRKSINSTVSSDFEVVPKSAAVVQCATASPVSALDLRTAVNGGGAAGTHGNKIVASTPVAGVQAIQTVDLSWADDDNEDSQAIEFYLPAVEKNDKGDRAGPQEKAVECARGGDKTNVAQSTSAKVGDTASGDGGVTVGVHEPDTQLNTSYADSVKMGAKDGNGTTGNKVGQAIKNTQMNRVPQKTYSKTQGANYGQNGARPKQPQAGPSRGAANPSGQPKNHNSAMNNTQSVRIVTRNGWKTKQVQGRNVSGGNYPPLQAGNVRPKRDIFVRGLAATIYSCKEEMEDAVRYYCEERGVGVFFMFIMPLQPGSEVANCRIAVAEEDGETVLQDSFGQIK